MKTMTLTGIRDIEMRDVPEPVISKPTDVLLKVGAIGVCGSDIHYYINGRIGSQIVKYPFTVGHECAAIVEKTGSHVTRVKPGDRVSVDPAISCYECDQCMKGRPNTCRNLKFLACPGQAQGCLSEYIVMPETCCFPIQKKTSLEQAALVEPLSIGIYAVKQSVPLEGANIGILGAGPIGLSVLLSALNQGAENIYMTDKLDERIKIAHSAGASWIGNPEKIDIFQEITQTEPLLLDVVFECCGEQEALDQAIEILKPGGKLMIIGAPAVDRVSFTIDLLRRKEICIQNVRRQNRCVQTALDLIEKGKIKPDFMITHHFDFNKTQEAFDLVANYDDSVIKAMIII
jgi:L-iditol 2-dehydrogenase